MKSNSVRVRFFANSLVVAEEEWVLCEFSLKAFVFIGEIGILECVFRYYKTKIVPPPTKKSDESPVSRTHSTYTHTR